MPLTNFPQGVSSFGIPMIGGLPVIPGGKVLFVQSTHSRASNGNNGEDRDRPLSTIQRAVNLCTDGAGDVIVCGPGHVETVLEAGGLSIDKAGVTIIGVGNGTQRAEIAAGGATSVDINIDAANVTWRNLLITGNIDAISTLIDVNQPHFEMLDCEYRDVVGQIGILWSGDANADFFVVNNFRYRGDAAAGTSRIFRLAGMTGGVIDGLYADGNFSAGLVTCESAAVVDLELRNCIARNRNSADIFLVDTITGSTGMIGPNIFFRAADNAANITEALTGATFVYHPNIFIVNNAGEVALATNITASTDA